MNITLPGSPLYDIASTTTASLAPYATVAELAGGVFLGLFVVQILFEAIGRRYYPQPEPESGMV